MITKYKIFENKKQDNIDFIIELLVSEFKDGEYLTLRELLFKIDYEYLIGSLSEELDVDAMDKSYIVDLVIDNIVENNDYGDYTVLDELLNFLTEEELNSVITKEKIDEYNIKKSANKYNL